MDELSTAEVAEMDEQYGNLFGDEPEVKDEPEVEVEVEEEVQIEESEEESDVEVETEEEEEVEFEYGDDEAVYKIGEEDVTAKDLASNYKTQEELKELATNTQSAREEVIKLHQTALENMKLAKREAEIILEDAGTLDWSNMTAEEYKTQKMNAEKLQEKVRLLSERVDSAQTLADQEASALRAEKSAKAAQTLQREIPGFNQEMYADVLTHAVSVLGVEKETALNLMDAGLIKLLVEAKKGYVDPAKTKKVSMPKKVSKSSKAVSTKKTGYVDGDPNLPAWAENLF